MLHPANDLYLPGNERSSLTGEREGNDVGRSHASAPAAVAAFAALVQQTQRPLYGYLRGLMADAEQARDLMQDVFCDAWRAAKQGSSPCAPATARRRGSPHPSIRSIRHWRQPTASSISATPRTITVSPLRILLRRFWPFAGAMGICSGSTPLLRKIKSCLRRSSPMARSMSGEGHRWPCYAPAMGRCSGALPQICMASPVW